MVHPRHSITLYQHLKVLTPIVTSFSIFLNHSNTGLHSVIHLPLEYTAKMVRPDRRWNVVFFVVKLVQADFSLYPAVDQSLLADAFGITVDCLDAL